MWIRTLTVAFLSLSAYATDCGGLAKFTLPHASVTHAELITGGPFQPPYGPPLTGLPAFCRVAMTAKPTVESDIRIELWMPQSGWNSRFEGTGNGGFAGRISYAAFATGVKLGYAVANTNMGTGAPADQDASVFTGHPEVWADWGFRSTHEMTILSKRVVQAFYEQAPRHAYFSGCSTGGEQALMESQRYPDDYEGIVAGAAANNRTGVHMSILWNFVVSTKAPIPKAKLASLNEAAVHTCGASDGIISNPPACHFDPAILQCTGADNDRCLTAARVETARRIYAGPTNPRTHQQLYPGLTPGSEFGWDQLAAKDQPPYAPIFQWVFGRMAHCSGGPGEDHIDPLSAVVDWVEKGTAPSYLIASKPGKGQRVLCPYPQTADANHMCIAP
jgi:feruloyl esterase